MANSTLTEEQINSILQGVHSRYANTVANLTGEVAQKDVMIQALQEEVQRLTQENDSLKTVIDKTKETPSDAGKIQEARGNRTKATQEARPSRQA